MYENVKLLSDIITHQTRGDDDYDDDYLNSFSLNIYKYIMNYMYTM